MTHICVMSSHKPIRIYMGVLILGVNTLYSLFCFFKLFPMIGKGLISGTIQSYPVLTGFCRLSVLNKCTFYDHSFVFSERVVLIVFPVRSGSLL